MHLLAFYILIFFFWFGAFTYGLIHEYFFLGMNAVLYLALLFIIFIFRKLNITYFHLWVLLYVLCYWISLFYAIDLEQAILEASRVSGILPLSLFTTMLQREQMVKLFKSWVYIGAFVTIVGIAGEMYRDHRLESTIGYANALAIFLLASLLISMMINVKEKKPLFLILMTINAAGLWLTYSRSVWVLWLISVCVLVLTTPEIRNKAAVLRLGLGHLMSFAVVMVIQYEYAFFLNRVKSIQPSTSELQIRLVYWKDSVAIILEHWFGGTGGGGWSVIQHLYQSKDYYVKFIHNHYIQILLDIGVGGLLLFLTMMVLFYKKILLVDASSEQQKLYGIWIAVTVILLHAGFDFDLSFPWLFGLLMCLISLVHTNTRLFTFSKMKLMPVMTFLIILTVFFSWLAVGYSYKELAIQKMRQGQLEVAQTYFSQAMQMVPWSSSLLYESAKTDILTGNQSGNIEYYDEALKKLQSAQLKVPEQKVYSKMNEGGASH